VTLFVVEEPTRDAVEKNRISQGSPWIRDIRISESIQYPVFHELTDIKMIIFIHELMCISILCLAEEDPDNNASFCHIFRQWNGLVARTSTHA
jgi:hypothetical protein